MYDFERHRTIEHWLKGVLLATVFVDPENVGLTREELLELASRQGFGKAEVLEHHALARCRQFERRWIPSEIMVLDLIHFHDAQDGDPRNLEAYQWVLDQFDEQIREHGLQRAKIPLNVLVERGSAAGFSKVDVLAAVVSYVLEGSMVEEDQAVRCQKPIFGPKAQLAQQGGQQNRGRRNDRHPVAPVLAQVRDIVARRKDGRPISTDPIRAFGARFSELAGANRRIWWEQQASELRTSNPHTHPTMMLVCAASLIEGALSAVVKRARELTSGAAFAGREFESPTNWKLESLLRGAKHPSAGIFTNETDALYQDAKRLNENRKRIHFAQYLLEDNPISIDIRPHDAVNAVTTAERVLTTLLEWLAERERKVT